MTEANENLLVLLILANKNFADAYQLCKVLSWKFGIINCSVIINRLETMEYILYTKPKTLKFFDLTIKGEKILQEKITSLEKILHKEYSGEKEFIDKLLSVHK